MFKHICWMFFIAAAIVAYLQTWATIESNKLNGCIVKPLIKSEVKIPSNIEFENPPVYIIPNKE